MNQNRLRLASLIAAGALFGLASSHAGIVRFNATINGAQDGNSSTATGTAALIYDVTSNKFDLTVTINNFPLTLTASHIHEAAVGVSGPIVVNFGAEVVYTRVGSTLTATFTNVTYTGTPATLLSGGAYVNYHSAAFPAGEIRGQLIPVPVKLTAIMNAAQETTTPAVVSNAYGASQVTYDPATNMITTMVHVYNFTNTLSASHIHEAAVGATGAITLGFGNAAVYTQSGTTYVQQFGPSAYPGSAVNLLSERAYVNVHSNVYGAGEIRGQLYVQDPSNHGRLVNVSARGQVGTLDNVLISGLYVAGNEPVRVLVTARGPGMAPAVPGTLADPVLSIYDSAGRLLFTNNNVATAPFQPLITAFNAVSFLPAESGVLLVLPPGGYTGIVSGAGNSTGVGLAEAFEVSW